MEWVVMKQNQLLPDDYAICFVNIDATTAGEAIEHVAMTADGWKGGQGHYLAFPNQYAVRHRVTVQKIAEVNVDPEGMV